MKVLLARSSSMMDWYFEVLNKYELAFKVKKSKAIPTTGGGGLYDCEKLRIPQCLNNRLTDGGEAVSLKHRPLSTFPNYFFCLWYSFLSEAV
jgi:hypothetical protein